MPFHSLRVASACRNPLTPLAKQNNLLLVEIVIVIVPAGSLEIGLSTVAL